MAASRACLASIRASASMLWSRASWRYVPAWFSHKGIPSSVSEDGSSQGTPSDRALHDAVATRGVYSPWR